MSDFPLPSVPSSVDHGTQRLALGLLDFCHVASAERPRSSLYQTLDLAVMADSLGFSRYWLAELLLRPEMECHV